MAFGSRSSGVTARPRSAPAGSVQHQPIAIIDGRSTDLAFGFRQGDAPELVMSSAQLHEMWNSPRRVFLIAYGSTAPAGAVVLLERPNYALVTNRPLRSADQRIPGPGSSATNL